MAKKKTESDLDNTLGVTYEKLRQRGEQGIEFTEQELEGIGALYMLMTLALGKEQALMLASGAHNLERAE